MSILKDLCNYLWGSSRYRPPVVYMPELDRLKQNTTLLHTFELSFCDAEAASFLQRASQGSLWKLVIARLLYNFFSFTLVNGILNTAQMYVISSEQLRRLLRPEGCEIHVREPSSGGSPPPLVGTSTTTTTTTTTTAAAAAAATETLLLRQRGVAATAATDNENGQDKNSSRESHRIGGAGNSTSDVEWDQRNTSSTTTANCQHSKTTDPPGGIVRGSTTTKVHYHTSSRASSSSSSAARKWEEDPAAVAALPTPHFDRILDIGAGDGNVTSRLLPFCASPADICVTEASASMRYRLQQRGFTVLDCMDPYHDPVTGERRFFDLITCFNLLDRIDTPQTMLNECRDSLRPGGYLLLAVVLPWCPFVENGNKQKRPREQLPMQGGECCKGASFEQSLDKLVQNVLVPTGFELVRWTRLPYLCQGDLQLDYAVLNDAVMVLKVK